jgi:hypothetical protein
MILNAVSPFEVEPRIFDLYISTKARNAPIIANDLVEACTGKPVNWVALGIIGVVNTTYFTDTVRVHDPFGLNNAGFPLKQQIVSAAAQAALHSKASDWPVQEREAFDVRCDLVWHDFWKFAESLTRGPKLPEIPKPTPVKPKPTEPVPVPQAPDAPAPAPAKPDSPAWKLIHKLSGWTVVVNILLVVFSGYIPAGVLTIIRTIITVIAELAAAHPVQAVVGVVSAGGLSIAAALNAEVPRAFREAKTRE